MSASYLVIISSRYLHALYNAKAIGEENAVDLKSAGLVKHPILGFLMLTKKVGKVGEKYYITDEYNKGMRSRWGQKNK